MEVVGFDTNAAETANLAFSEDGRVLREVRLVSSGGSWHVRALTYDSARGVITRQWNLQSHTTFLSASSDGRKAIISLDVPQPEKQANPFLLDTETGRTEDLPSTWFDPDDRRPVATISGDGRLVSVYSGAGPDNMVVSVYDLLEKKLVAKQMRGYIVAGGAFGGGVTEDGKIEFSNNRVGSDIVDRRTGQLIVHVGPNSHRSRDAAWIIEFPDPTDEDTQREVLIKNGESGKLIGKLALQITDEEANSGWRSAFCGTSGRFIAGTDDAVRAFELPSG